MISRDEALERIREMHARVVAGGLRGPFTLAVQPDTLREWGSLPPDALPADVTVVAADWAPSDEVTLLDEDQYRYADEWWQDLLSMPEP